MSLKIFLSGNKVNLCLLDSDVDLSEYLDKLLNAYSCYADEMRDEPHARSLEALKIEVLRRGREASPCC